MLREQFADTFQGLDERVTVDTSENRTTYLLVGKNGSHVQLSPSAYNLLKIYISGASYEEVSKTLMQRGTRVAPEELEAACVQVAEHVLEIDRNTDRSAVPQGFWFRIRLLPSELVGWIATRLTFTFERWSLAILLAFSALAVAVIWNHPPASLLDEGIFWPAYGLLLVSLICHELGHATACARFGAPPYDIGFTVYLVYPAFYSDVSAAWQLNRWQRVGVDLGGAYFQIVVGALYCGLYWLSGWEPLALAFWMILYGLAFSLNPIFRFDGYWVLTDALGVTHLSKQPLIMVRHFYNRLRGRKVEPLPWPRQVTLVLLLYTPATFLFWGYFLGRILPMLLQQAQAYPRQLAALVEVLISRSELAEGQLHGIVVSTFLLSIVALMIWRLLGPLLKILAFKVKQVFTGRQVDAAVSQPAAGGG